MMDALHLHILPVYSEYHSTEQIGEQRLLKHQVETLQAFNDVDVDVIINTAMTGDGKSLAGYLSAFQQQQPIIAMYPTNELIKDQFRALERYRDTLGVRLPTHSLMFGERITQLMQENNQKTRLEEVKNLLLRNGILLTNPDLVHLIMSHQYGWDFMRKELPAITGMQFDYYLFDEFHTFEVPQVVSVINMLGYLHANYGHKTNERRKYVFLSATPTPLLKSLLTRSGLRCQQIEGHYRNSDQGSAYRRILQGCEISLEAISQDRSTEQWIEEHLPKLLQFFQKYGKETKAAVLVYSPATARRLFIRLTKYFQPYGITVGENTGLTDGDERRDALNKHILVGTSTVDVGIDFHINYLIFEAFNAGSFLQRFGRLGRHDEFPEYRAYGLVPNFILERLTQEFKGQSELDRPTFNAKIREAYPTEQEFSGYTQRWGVVQAAHVLEELQSHQKQDANHAFHAALTQQYEQIYGTQTKPAMERARKKYWKLKHHFSEVLADLLSFRGQSRLDCGVWDLSPSQIPKGGSLLTYDLFFLLANTQFEVIEKEEFLQEVRRRKLEERDFQKKLLYLKIHEYVPERLDLVLGHQTILSEQPEALHRVAVWSDIFIQKPSHTWRDRVNRSLKGLDLTCIVSNLQPQELKRQYQLSGTFHIYRLEDSLGSPYSIMFGQEALLIDPILAFRAPKGNNPMMA
jgi:CRISPR-associated endonuclease/helicase Cas3